jgi:CubicO group peptidase (beta-lactamase class C family)
MLQTRVTLQKAATGIVVGIAEPKRDRVLAYGAMGLDDKRPVDGRTEFDIGSITKVFTALLLSDMVERYEVRLNDPVGKFLPGVTLPQHNGIAITLADLATHTSGLPLRPTNLPSNDPANPYKGYTRDEFFAFLSSYTLPRDPGSRYEYSNVGYGLLAQSLSARTAKSYADLVRSRITDGLGMSDTGMAVTDSVKARMPVGYDGDFKPVPHWDMGALEGAGAYHSTANDLLKLLDAELGLRNSALTPALAAMTKTRRPGGMGPATAIALAWNVFDDGAREIIWKNGSVGGFRAFIGYDRKARLGIVVLTNAQTANGGDDIGLHFLDPSYPADTEIPRPHVEIALSAAVLDQFVGRYRFSPTDFITVSRNGDHLYVVPGPGQPPLEMYAERPDSFFLKVANIQLRFSDIASGHATRTVWHQSGQDQSGVYEP